MQIIPSIIDYVINIGLKETSDQWIEHLKNNGSLESNIFLKSNIDELMKNSYDRKLFNNIYKLYQNKE